jgi:hypothetical protein
MKGESMPPDFLTEMKPLAIRILDEISLSEVRTYYGKTPGYDAKSRLLLDLGIPADYFGALAPDINEILRGYPGAGGLTSIGLRNCNTIGDFISLFSTAAGATVPPGEPK